MKFHLYRSEVLFNRAMCKEMLDDNAGALDDIAEAQKYCRDGLQSAIIQNAARSGIKEVKKR